MGREKPRGLLKIEMSLGEEKSIWAMNLLVQTDGEKPHNSFFFFKDLKIIIHAHQLVFL